MTIIFLTSTKTRKGGEFMAEHVKPDKCEGDHSEHVCYIAYQGDFKKAAEMAEGGRYICTNCGRSAKERKNLCAPSNIKNILYFGRE